MGRFRVRYAKYGIDIARYYGYDYICLSAIFTHNNISYLIYEDTHKKRIMS